MPRFLVVEDEFFVAAYIEGLLNEEGLEVVGPVSTLDEAKRMASEQAIDGALLDINLGGDRVDDVADILARRNVPFIFVTAYGRNNIPPGHRDAAIVHKPFNDAVFMRQVRRLSQ